MPIQDAYSSLEHGVEQLIARLGQKHSEYKNALLYQAQLEENIQLVRMYGDTEQRRADRSIILEKFIILSLDNFGISFKDLCLVIDSSLETNDLALNDAEKIIHSESYRRDIKRLFELGKVAPFAEGCTTQLIESVANTISQDITENIIDVKINDWKFGRIQTLNDVLNSVQIETVNHSQSKETRQKIKLLVDEWHGQFAMDLYQLLAPIHTKYHLAPTIPNLRGDYILDEILDEILSVINRIPLEEISGKELDFMNSLEKSLPVEIVQAVLLLGGTIFGGMVLPAFLSVLLSSILFSLPTVLGAIIVIPVTMSIAAIGHHAPMLAFEALEGKAAQKLLTVNLPLDIRRKITQKQITAQLQIVQKFIKELITTQLKDSIKPTALLEAARHALGESSKQI